MYMHPQRANIPLQGLDRRALADSGSHIRSPQPTWNPPLASFHQSWIYMVGKKHSGKADQSTLASGDSEHAYVAISWGIKINFSLSANMSGFCSDSHIYSRILIIRISIIRTLVYPNTILNFKIPKDTLIFCKPKQ